MPVAPEAIALARRDLLKTVAGFAGGQVPTAAVRSVLEGAAADGDDSLRAVLAALAALVVERHEAAAGLVRALVAAEPPGVVMLARMEPLTSLARAGAGGEGLNDLVSGTEDGTEDGAVALAQLREEVGQGVAALAVGRALPDEERARLASVLGRETELWAVRADKVRTRVLAAPTPDRDRMFHCVRWTAETGVRRRLIARLAGPEPVGDLQAARSRLAATLPAGTLAHWREVAAQLPDGARLARVLGRLAEPELKVPDPAAALVRLLALVAAQGEHVLLAKSPDLLLLASLVLEQGRGCWLQVDIPGDRIAAALREGLDAPPGVVLKKSAMLVACTGAREALPPLPTGMEADDEKQKDEGQSALKHLVITSMQCTSILLEFLRDPKVKSIPGLVAEVANRTRNPQVLTVIANDRTLHSGFANRTVPLVLLRSPVNVPVRTIRRFAHVKYVSKVDLKRMGKDKAGLRKEVHHEVLKYLATLA